MLDLTVQVSQNGGNNGSGVIGVGGSRVKNVVSISRAFSIIMDHQLINIASGCGGGGGDSSAAGD